MSLPTIILDTDKSVPLFELPLKIRTGDKNDVLSVILGSTFGNIDVTNKSVEFVGNTPAGKMIKAPATEKSGKTFKFKFVDEMYASVGAYQTAYFKIGDDSTSNINIIVLKGIGPVTGSGDYIDDFENLIAEAMSYVKALKATADSGNALVTAKVKEVTDKMDAFIKQASIDLAAAKKSFSDAEVKSVNDAKNQRDGFNTGYQQLKATLQADYDAWKKVLDTDVAGLKSDLATANSKMADVTTSVNALQNRVAINRRNYLLNTAKPITIIGNNSVNQQSGYTNLSVDSLSSFLKIGDSYTVAFDWKVSGNNTSASFQPQFGAEPYNLSMGTVSNISNSNNYGHVAFTKVAGQPEIDSKSKSMRFRIDNLTGTLTVTNFSLRKTMIDSDWSPAPEDVDFNRIGSRNHIDSNKIIFYQASGSGNTKKLTLTAVDDSTWAGVKLLFTDIAPGKTYLLTFDYKLIDGTVTGFGGDIVSAKAFKGANYFKINNILSGDFQNGIQFTPEVGKTYHIEVSMTAVDDFSNTISQSLYIQPNRRNAAVWSAHTSEIDNLGLYIQGEDEYVPSVIDYQENKATSDEGSYKYKYMLADKTDLKKEISKLPTGVQTFFVEGGVTNNPAGSSPVRGMIHITSHNDSGTIGYGFIEQAGTGDVWTAASTYTNNAQVQIQFHKLAFDTTTPVAAMAYTAMVQDDTNKTLQAQNSQIAYSLMTGGTSDAK